MIRRATVNFYRYTKPVVPEKHIAHCLDSLRQDVMCYADDTPMVALPHQGLGHSQPTMCRNWDLLLDWARQPLFESCWNYKDEYRTIENRIERYQFCSKNSKYYPRMLEYFNIHGHQKMYAEHDV
jgi:hypothetical protein